MLPEGYARSSATSYRKLGGSIRKTPFRSSLSRGAFFLAPHWGNLFGRGSGDVNGQRQAELVQARKFRDRPFEYLSHFFV